MLNTNLIHLLIGLQNVRFKPIKLLRGPIKPLTNRDLGWFGMSFVLVGRLNSKNEFNPNRTDLLTG